MNFLFAVTFPFCLRIIVPINAVTSPNDGSAERFSDEFGFGRIERQLDSSTTTAADEQHSADGTPMDYQWIFHPFVPSLDFLSDLYCCDQNAPKKEVIGGGKGGGGAKCVPGKAADLSKTMCDSLLEELIKFADQLIVDPHKDKVNEKKTLTYKRENKKEKIKIGEEKFKRRKVNGETVKITGEDSGKMAENYPEIKPIKLFENANESAKHLANGCLSANGNPMENAENLLKTIYLCIELTVSPIPIIGRAIVEQKTVPKCLMCPRVMAHFALSLLEMPPFYAQFGPTLEALKKRSGENLTVLKCAEEILGTVEKKGGETVAKMERKVRNLQFYALFYALLSAFARNGALKKAVGGAKSARHAQRWEGAAEFVQLYAQLFEHQLHKVGSVGLGQAQTQLGHIKSGQSGWGKAADDEGTTDSISSGRVDN